MSPKSSLGGEVHDYQLIKELCKHNFDVSVLLPKGREYESSTNLKVEYLPIKHIVPPHLFNLLALPYLLKKKKSFDILRFHNPYFLGIAGYFLKKLYPDTKIVTTIHLREDRMDLDWILRKTIRIYDHIFTVSEYLKGWIIETYGYPSSNITVVYNGVDENLKIITKPQNLIKKYNSEDKIVLLNVGALIERKNVKFLVEVFNRLSQIYPNLCLIICGQGDLENELKDTLKEYFLDDKVFIEGPVYGDEKNLVFNLADVFLFPSKNEGFGIVAAEAMSVGKPVIGADNTSIPELIDDKETGFLAKTNDMDDWIDKISKLIEDKSLRNKMGQKGAQKAKRYFNWGQVYEATSGIFREIVQ